MLGFDTATETTVVAITEASGGLVCESGHESPAGERPAHASDLLPAIEECIGIAGGWERIGRIGIGVGPGSFTGLRVAVASGRALAQATGHPAVPVSTLDALIVGARESEVPDGRPLLAVLDARREEAFVSLAAVDGSIVIPDRCVGAEEFHGIVEQAGSPPLAFGEGSLRFSEELEDAGAEVLPADSPAHTVAARCVCRLAAEATPGSIEQIQPVYLREPDATRWLERDRKQDE